MAPSRLKKRITRALMVSWREQPTRYDIEALQANIARVGLVIRVRWVLVTVLVIYSLFGGAMYAARIPLAELMRLMWIPAFTLGFVVLYNAFYSINYRRLGNIAVWNHLQLALDALVVTVLVHYSGGVNSWFWSMYSLFILEAGFILPRKRDVWLVMAVSVLLLGGVEIAELLDIIPHADIPFASPALHQDWLFVVVRYFWQVAVLAGTAWVSSLLVEEFRRELEARGSHTILDSATGLYSRSYVMRALGAEVRRAQRDRRELHVLLLDIDRFGDFNARFGFDRGDRMLKLIAEAINECVSEVGDTALTTNLAGRFGGEEFIVVYAEDARSGNAPSRQDALQLAERLRSVIEAVRIDGAGVTVSVGIATMPQEGTNGEALLDIADDALSSAIERGGNAVGTAPQPSAPTVAEA